MEVVQELNLLMMRFGDQVQLEFNSGFELSIPMSVLVVPNTLLTDNSTLLKIQWQKESIGVSFEPEDGVVGVEDLTLNILDKCSQKRTLGSIIRAVTNFFAAETDSAHSSNSGRPLRYNKLEEEYEAEDTLGHGGFGDVFKYRNKLDGMQYAVKVIGFDISDEADILREVKALCLAQHENVVRFYHAWIESEKQLCVPGGSGGSDALDSPPAGQKCICIAMECCASTLRKELNEGKIFSDGELQKIYTGVAKGLTHIHQQHIIHRDLSRDNIFLDSKGVAKIGDFGCAVILNPDDVSINVHGGGKHMYDAPELDSGLKVTNKIDMFAFGLIMFELLYPMNVERKVRAFRNIKEGKLPSDLKYDGPLGVFVPMLLHVDPEKRLSAEDAVRHMDSRG